MGIAIKCGANFSVNLGKVHPKGDDTIVPITAITDIVTASLGQNKLQCTAILEPSSTTQTGITWSIVSGNADIDGSGVISYNSSGSIVVKAVSVDDNTISKQKTFDVTYEDAVIVFADPTVKSLLNVPLNENGEITLSEAAKIGENTSIYGYAGSIFKEDPSNITSFDELRFFTGIKRLTVGSKKVNFTHLTSIKFPDSITGFVNAYGETSSALTLGSSGAVCPITELTLPSILERLDSICTYTNIEGTFVVHSNVKVSGKFEGCTNLKKVVYQGCELWRDQEFKNSSVEVVDFSDSLSRATSQLFRGSSLKTVIIRATTPPTWETPNWYLCPSDTKIYVPDGAVNDYKTADGWKEGANRFYPLSELPADV